MLYYELCEKVWGGSPATEQIATGIESGDLPPSVPESAEQPDEKATSHSSQDSTIEIAHRRDLLAKNPSDYRQKKLKRKLPMDAQLLECAQEELSVKKVMLDRMEKMDKQYMETMDRLSKNMETLTNSIAEGFALMRSSSFPPTAPGMYQSAGAYSSNPYIPHGSGTAHSRFRPPFNTPVINLYCT